MSADNPMRKNKTSWRTISIPRQLYEKLQKIAEENGYTNVSQLVQFYLRLLVRGDIEL